MVQAGDWNEELFKEAMIRAVDGMTTTSPSSLLHQIL